MKEVQFPKLVLNVGPNGLMYLSTETGTPLPGQLNASIETLPAETFVSSRRARLTVEFEIDGDHIRVQGPLVEKRDYADPQADKAAPARYLEDLG